MVRADELPHLEQMVDRVRDRDEPSARPQHPRDLGEPAVEVRDVVEHPGGHGAVEALGGQVERLHVAETGVDSAAPRSSTMRSELSTATTVTPSSFLQPLRELAGPGPTSSTRRGVTSATAANATSRASGPTAFL